MSFVNAVPEALISAATDLAGIGSTISAANTAAAVQTTSLVAAAQDEVSGAIAALFSARGQEFHALSAQAAGFHDKFVQAMTEGSQSYVTAEAANTTPLGKLATGYISSEQALDKLLDVQVSDLRYIVNAGVGINTRLVSSEQALSYAYADGEQKLDNVVGVQVSDARFFGWGRPKEVGFF
jgi:hypothetical protein